MLWYSFEDGGSIYWTCNDERGIIWLKAIAPYDVAIVPIGYNKNEKIKSFADSIYKKLIENNIQPLLDDRDISAGLSFQTTT